MIRIRCLPSSDTSDRRRSVLCVPTCLAHIIVVNYNIVAVRSICYRVSGGQVGTELTATPHERNARRGDRLIIKRHVIFNLIVPCVAAEAAAATAVDH